MRPPYCGVGVPRDRGDFGRCHRLLQAFPHYRERLPEVAAKYPMWVGLVREWDNLTGMFEAGKTTSLHNAIEDLVVEGRIADGQVPYRSPGCWVNKEGRA